MFPTDQNLKVSEIWTSNSPVWRERWLWSIELRGNKGKDEVDLIQRGDFHTDEIMMLCFIALTSLGLYSICTGALAVSVSHGDERNTSSGGSQPLRNFGTYRGAHWSFGQSALRYKDTPRIRQHADWPVSPTDDRQIVYLFIHSKEITSNISHIISYNNNIISDTKKLISVDH